MLGRLAFIVAATAAVPVLLKKNRRLADQVGDSLMKAGEKLKKEYGVEAAGAPKKDSAASATASKPASAGTKVKAAVPKTARSKAKAPAAAKPSASAKAKPRPTAKSAPKRKPARKKPASKPTESAG